jgi:hypothetical protein
MLAIAGHWELSWNTPIKEADLWNLPLRDFGVDEWWMWPVSGIRNSEPQVSFNEVETFAEILQRFSDFTKVFVEPRSPFPLESKDLHEFDHPEEDCVYIFGSAHFNPTVANKTDEDLAVTIPTAQNSGVLWPHQCAVTVLYDRLVKSWQ